MAHCVKCDLCKKKDNAKKPVLHACHLDIHNTFPNHRGVKVETLRPDLCDECIERIRALIFKKK